MELRLTALIQHRRPRRWLSPWVPDPTSYETIHEEIRSNVVPTVGTDFYHQQCFKTSGLASNGANYIACSADALTETTASTNLTSEISANGFSRAQATVTHTNGTNVSSLAKTFTASGSQRVQKIGVFTASSSGTLCHVLAITDRTYASGDLLVFSATIGLTSSTATVLGHTLDGSTIALWRLDETAEADYSLVDAGPNVRTTNVVSGTAAQIVPGPRAYTGRKASRTQGCLARYNRSISAYSQCSSSAGSDATAMQGNWTAKAWVYLDALASSTIIAYAGSNALETSATNYQMRLFITSGGNLDTLWEQGAGVNVTPVTTGAFFGAAGWHHIAAVKTDDLVNVGKKKVTFYYDGVNKQTISNLTNADGGGSATWWLGGDDSGASGTVGKFRSVMITSNVCSDSDITADAANTSGANAYTHTDTNVIVHYKCDEVPDTWDDAGNYHMRRLTGVPPGAVAGTFDVAEQLINDGGKARHWDASSEYQSSIYLNETMRQAGLNSFTWEGWIKTEGIATQRGLFCFGDPSSESSANNHLCIDVLTDGTVQYNIEHSSGTNATATSGAIFTGSTKYSRVHLAVTKKVVGGTATVQFFLNGVQVGSDVTGVTDFDGGTNDVLRLGIGTGSTANRFAGVMDDVRISNVCRSASEILASYQAGV